MLLWSEEDTPLPYQGATQRWTHRGWALAWAVPWIPSPPADAMEEGLEIIDRCLVASEGNCTSFNNLILSA